MKRRIVLSLALVLIIFMFLSCNIVVIESEQNTVIEEQNIEYGMIIKSAVSYVRCADTMRRDETSWTAKR